MARKEYGRLAKSLRVQEPLVKESERDRMIFFDLEGNETEGEWDRQRAELRRE